MSSPRPASTVNSKPVPVLTSIASTPSRQARAQHAGAGAGDLRYLTYPAGEILFANVASVKRLPRASLFAR